MLTSKRQVDVPKISVIVPVYNAAKTLLKCSDSILSQTFTDFEVIFVNDGSTDNSAEELKKIQNDNTRVKVFNQDNRGTGEARNYGIREAVGEYICFVDSDDSLQPRMLEELLNASHNKDIVVCDYQEVSESGLSRTHKYDGPSDLYGYLGTILSFQCASSVWAKLFHRDLFNSNDCFFPDGLRNNEDNALLFKLLFFAKTINFVSIPLYRWNRRKGSKSRMLSTLRLRETIEVLASRKEFLKKYGLLETYFAEFYRGVIYTLSLRKRQIERFIEPPERQHYMGVLHSSLLKTNLIERTEFSALNKVSHYDYWQFIFFMSEAKESRVLEEFRGYIDADDWKHALNCQVGFVAPEIYSLKYFAEKYSQRPMYVYGVGETWQKIKSVSEKEFEIIGFIDRSFSNNNSMLKFDLDSVFEVMQDGAIILVASINQAMDIVNEIKEHRLYHTKSPMLVTFIGSIDDW